MIGGRFTVRHQGNGAVATVCGGRLAARHIFRCASARLSEVRVQIHERGKDHLGWILLAWLSPLNKGAARLNNPVAPLQARDLPAMHLNGGHTGAPTRRINNPVTLQKRSLRARPAHAFTFRDAGAFGAVGAVSGASPRSAFQIAAMRIGIPSATCSKMRLRGPSARSG